MPRTPLTFVSYKYFRVSLLSPSPPPLLMSAEREEEEQTSNEILFELEDAARRGAVDDIKDAAALLSAEDLSSADFNSRVTAATLAAVGGHRRALEVLRGMGCEPSIELPGGGGSALKLVRCEAGARLLMELGAKFDEEALEAVLRTLRHDGDVCAAADAIAFDAGGADLSYVPPLRVRVAAMACSKRFAQRLLAAGVPADLPPAGDSCFLRWGWRALHVAARCGRAGAVEALLDAGAEVDSRDKRQGTPLMLAGSAAVAELLHARGADLDARTRDGYTALLLVHQDRELLKYGPSPGAVAAIARLGANVLDVHPWHSHSVLVSQAWRHDSGAHKAVEGVLAAGAPPTAKALVCSQSRGSADALLAYGAKLPVRPMDPYDTPQCVIYAVNEWKAGEHPVQRARAALEDALLEASGGMPADVASVCGSYVHVGQRAC